MAAVASSAAQKFHGNGSGMMRIPGALIEAESASASRHLESDWMGG
jgi:hypothetical protein